MRAKRRDDNEPAIVAALEAVGCAVLRLNETGAPDLLVSFRGVLRLLEVKLPLRQSGAVQHREHKGGGKENADMTVAQVKWWREWKGLPPIVVRDQWEALRAVGFVHLSGRRPRGEQ